MKKIFFLRTCDANLRGHGGFQWPEKGGIAVAPDWSSEPTCSGGLFGNPWGEGDCSMQSTDPTAKWLVCSADEKTAVFFDRKVKVPAAKVLFVGTRDAAVAYLKRRCPKRAVAWCIVTAGDYGTATAGRCGMATAGRCGTATAGDYGTATAGDYGTATAGSRSTVTVGDGGTATAGYCSTVTVGDNGTATVGGGGTATAGNNGKAAAGDRGTIVVAWWDGIRMRRLVGYIGENGLKPGVQYRVANGKFVKA